MNVDLAGLGNLRLPAGFIQKRRYRACERMRKPMKAAPVRPPGGNVVGQKGPEGGDICIPMAGSC